MMVCKRYLVVLLFLALAPQYAVSGPNFSQELFDGCLDTECDPAYQACRTAEEDYPCSYLYSSSSSSTCFHACDEYANTYFDEECRIRFRDDVVKCLRTCWLTPPSKSTKCADKCTYEHENEFRHCWWAARCVQNSYYSNATNKCECLPGYKFKTEGVCVDPDGCYGPECDDDCMEGAWWDEERQECVGEEVDGKIMGWIHSSKSKILSIPKDPATYTVDVRWATYDSKHESYVSSHANSMELTVEVDGEKLSTGKLILGEKPKGLGKSYALWDNGLPVVRLGYVFLDQIEGQMRKGYQPGKHKGVNEGQDYLKTLAVVPGTLKVMDGTGAVIAEAASKPEEGLFKYVIKRPVIFVPGIGGSRLFRDDGTEQWIGSILCHNSVRDCESHWEYMAITEVGISLNLIAKDILREPFYQTDVYQPFIDFMTMFGYSEGKGLLVFPYDWRLDNRAHSNPLGKLVDDIIRANYARGEDDAGNPATDKVVIVAHSMGGLVTRHLLQDPSYADKVDTVIMLGTPNNGAPKAFIALGGVGYGFENSLITNERAKSISRNWPAAYQLLPTFDYHYGGDGKLVEREVAYYRYVSHLFGKQVGLNDKLIADAKAFHDEIAKFPEGVNLFIIAGHEKDTTLSVRVDPVHKVDECCFFGYCEYQPDMMSIEIEKEEDGYLRDCRTYKTNRYVPQNKMCGDGTVPLDSTILPEARMFYAKGVGHTELTQKRVSLDKVKQLLLGKIPGDSEKPCNSMPA
ncbi:hypothetical protein ACFLRF_06505 [Candidatus Altiarchaeota archaeon]